MAKCIHGNEGCPNLRCREDAVMLKKLERDAREVTGDMTLNELFDHVDGEQARFRAALRKLGKLELFEQSAIAWGLELHERQTRGVK